MTTGPSKLRAVVVYRLERHDEDSHAKKRHQGGGAASVGKPKPLTVVARFHAPEEISKIATRVIHNAPPGIPTSKSLVGGIKVRRSGDLQLVYGADGNGVCE